MSKQPHDEPGTPTRANMLGVSATATATVVLALVAVAGAVIGYLLSEAKNTAAHEIKIVKLEQAVAELKSKEMNGENLQNLFNTDKEEIALLRTQVNQHSPVIQKHDTLLLTLEIRQNKHEADLADTCNKISAMRERLATLEERTSQTKKQ